MAAPSPAFVHRFVPGAEGAAPVLLLLHGTGGNEDDLVPLGRQLWPGAALLSPRGQVLEQGMPRFFRRIAQGVFDQDDLRARTETLADFVHEAAEQYRFAAERVVAVGYSNGANIAASVLLRRPDAFSRAVLWHAQVPFEPESPPDLTTHQVLMTAGKRDPIVPSTGTERLRDLLATCGAIVQLAWFESGHALSQEDVDAARRWLPETFARALA
jgi:phospholipase/carboxylesterase/glyoxalase family protein